MIFAFDGFELDAKRLELRRGPDLVKVDTLVLRLLVALLRRAGTLVTKEELVTEVWEGRAISDNVITVTMARLRKALEERRGGLQMIATVYGRGYRFVRPVVARATSERPLASGYGGAHPGSLFVGRERVLERLRGAMSAAHAGRGSVCLLLGDPGIGKTRVVEQFAEELASTRTSVAWGFCREGGDTPPLRPWLRILRKVYEELPRESWVHQLGAAADELQQLLDLGTADDDGNVAACLQSSAWIRRFETIGRALALAAPHKRWLLVLDDLHRADAASLELLMHLLDEIPQTGLLIVATVRSAKSDGALRTDAQLSYLLGHRNCERITLEQLRESDVRAYVAGLLGDPDGRLGRAIFEKSEGNPFFMTEFVKQLADEETPDPDVLTLPDAALDVVRRRFAKLDGETYRMLSIAAVLGRSFELWLLAAVSEREASELMAALDEAIAHDLVVAAPDSASAFAFAHELLRVALYDALPPAEQRRYHVRAAHALEQRAESGSELVPPSAIAYHLYAAMPETDLAKTLHYCQQAANAATSAYANADVARYLRHALEALALMEQPSLPLRMALLLRLALHRRGHEDVFVPTIREVVRLARSLRDGATLTMAAAMYLAHPELVHVPGASEALSEALELLPPERSGMRAVALAVLACAAPQCYSAERSRALFSEADALARKSGSNEGLHVVLLCRLYAEGGARPGPLAVAEELERMWCANPSRMPMVPLFLARHRAMASLQLGDLRATDAALESAAARARQLHHSEMLWHAERSLALARFNAGEWPEALLTLDRLQVQAALDSVHGAAPFCAFDRMVLRRELSAEPVPLDDVTRRALAYDDCDPPSLWSLKLRALYAAGQHGEARAALEAVTAAGLLRLPHDSQYLGTLGHVARSALGLGALAYVQTLYSLLAPFDQLFAAHVSFYCEGSIAQLRGMLAAALGRPKEAVSLLELGITLAERASLPLAAADARLALAHCLKSDVRERARVISLAREVQTSSSQLGAVRMARAAAALLSNNEASSAARWP